MAVPCALLVDDHVAFFVLKRIHTMITLRYSLPVFLVCKLDAAGRAHSKATVRGYQPDAQICCSCYKDKLYDPLRYNKQLSAGMPDTSHRKPRRMAAGDAQTVVYKAGRSPASQSALAVSKDYYTYNDPLPQPSTWIEVKKKRGTDAQMFVCRFVPLEADEDNTTSKTTRASKQKDVVLKHGALACVLRNAKGNEFVRLWLPGIMWKPVTHHALVLRPSSCPVLQTPWTLKPPRRIVGKCPVVLHASTPGQTMCNRPVHYWPFCNHHLDTLYGVQVRPSSIKNAGLGLWTTRDINSQRIKSSSSSSSLEPLFVCPYVGELITPGIFKLRYPDEKNEYVIACNNKTMFYDAQVRRGVGAMANCSDKDHRSNVEFVLRPLESQVDSLLRRSRHLLVSGNSMHHLSELSCVWLTVRPNTTIPANCELFANYNDRKWKQEMQEQQQQDVDCVEALMIKKRHH